jgi:hypothetical protein
MGIEPGMSQDSGWQNSGISNMEAHVAGLCSHWEPQHRLSEAVITVWLVVNHWREDITWYCD